MDKVEMEDRSINLIFGTAMHETIQEWLAVHFTDEKKSRRMDLHPVLREKLKTLFLQESPVNADGVRQYLCDRPTLEEYYVDGCEILNHVQKYARDFFPTRGYELVGCEIPLELPVINNVVFKAYIDIVIFDKLKKQYHIIDLKTSTRGWWKFQKENQTKLNQILFYKHFYAIKFNVPLDDIIPKFIILKRKITENSEFIIRRLTNFEPSHGTVSMKRATNSLETFLTECFDSRGEYVTDVTPTPSASACKYCPFRDTRHCAFGIGT